MAATIGAMRPTPAELEVARALIARVKAADPSIKRVDELLVCAAVACRADELGGVPATLRSGDGQEHLEAEASDRLGLDWVARLEKKLEHTLAAESGSGLLVQPAWIEKNVPDRLPTNSLVRKIPACLCQVHRLLAADRGWGGASAHLEALRGVGVDQGTIRVPGAMGMAIASTCPLTATDNAQGSQARLGPRLMPPQSQLLAYGPASPVNKSVELALRSRTSPTRRPVMCAAPRKRPRTGPHASMACRAMLASGKGF